MQGQDIYAYVTLNSGVVASEDLLEAHKAHVRHEIGAIATPNAVQSTSGLPKVRSSKIMHRILRKITDGEMARSATFRRWPICRWKDLIKGPGGELQIPLLKREQRWLWSPRCSSIANLAVVRFEPIACNPGRRLPRECLGYYRPATAAARPVPTCASLIYHQQSRLIA